MSAQDDCRKKIAANDSRAQPSSEGSATHLTPEEVHARLRGLPGWELESDGKRIFRQWTLKDFATALRFFMEVGQLAEVENHHPDLHLQSYRHVRIVLWTHAVGGLTPLDFQLAEKINALATEYS